MITAMVALIGYRQDGDIDIAEAVGRKIPVLPEVVAPP